jgi:Fe-S-cluster containining protein
MNTYQIEAAPTTQSTRSGGTIALCPHKGCNFCCTEFTSGNYIVLYPGELEKAAASGLSMAHLKVIDENYYGGARAICEAKERKNCDGGYKPLDCASYPFFPAPVFHDPELSNVDGLVKGTKCPLIPAEIREHERWVRDIWNALIVEKPTIIDWLRQVRLVGYEPVETGVPADSAQGGYWLEE